MLPEKVSSFFGVRRLSQIASESTDGGDGQSEWLEAVGQSQPLIMCLQNVPKDYSWESLPKEFLQNADDAGATKFALFWIGAILPTGENLC